MASRDLIVFENGRYKRRVSSSETLDFLSVKIGATGLEIKESSGAFDFSAKELTNIANATSDTSAASRGQVKSLIDSAAGSGLSGSSGVLSVNVDGSTIEIATDTLQVKSGGIGTTQLADDSVDKAKIAADVAGNGLTQALDGSLQVNSGDGLEINTDILRVKPDVTGAANVAKAIIVSGNGVGVKVDDSSIEGDGTTGQLKVKALGISTGMIQASAVDKTKIASDVAGDGLGQDVDGSLKVKVDGSSLEVTSDQVQVKADGITKTHINSDVAGSGLGQNLDGSLEVNVGDGLEISSDAVKAKADATGGANLAKAVNVSANGLAVKVDGSTIEGDSTSGQLKVKDLGITTGKIAANAVTGAKIRLENNEYLRANPYAGVGADVDIIKVDESNVIQLASLPRNSSIPSDPADLVNKAYADSLSAGLNPKSSCRVATAAPLPACDYDNGTSGVGATLTAQANSSINDVGVDGLMDLVVGQRILVKNQAAGAQNGIYEVSVVGDAGTKWVLTRSVDFDGSPENEVDGGEYTFVTEGSTFADCGFVVASPNTTATIGTTAIVWTQFSAAGVILAGAGLLQTGNTFDVVAADNSLTVNANSVQVKLDAAGAISVGASGLKSEVDGSSIEISSNKLQVKADGITKTHIAADVAGSGLGQNLDGSLEVNVDGTTLEIATDTVQIKSGGVGTTQLANDSVDKTKIASDVAGSGLGQNVDGSLEVNIGDAIQISSDAVAVDFTKAKTNDNAGSITAGQVVYVKSNGNVDLAQASVATIADAELGVVSDASIATSASGKVFFRRGAVISGFSGMTPGKVQYVSRATAGALTESLSGFVAGEHVYQVGRALSATELVFNPEYIIEY